MVTTSALLSFSIFSYDVKCGTPHCVPASAARFGSASHTATSSRPSIFSMASKWFLLIRPAPARAILKFCSELNSGCSPKLVSFLPVRGAARFAPLGFPVGKPFPALAHPAHPPRRDPDHQRVCGDVFGDNAARADERVLVERDSAHDCRVRA